MTTRELTPYDTGEVCEPKPWRAEGDDFGKVDFDNDERATVIAGLRVVPNPGAPQFVTIEFGSNADYVTIREANGVPIRITNATDGQDTREAKIAMAQRSIDQSADTTEDLETALADTLANIYHWCDERGVDYLAAAERAESYKIQELADWAELAAMDEVVA